MIFPNEIERIYNDYVDDLYAYAIHTGFDHDTAMDAIHDLFCKLCDNQEQLIKVKSIRNYLFGALKNTLLNTSRKKKNIISFPDFSKSENHFFNIKITIEDDLITEEEQRKIKHTILEMLNSLPPRQREILFLRYIDEHSYEEISQKMSIDKTSCHKLLHKAMTSLRQKFGKKPLLLLLLLLH